MFDVSFSVIIPAYNCADVIGRAIDSVLTQTCPASEIIVVDDGSTDNTAEIVKDYGDVVHYFRQENQGPSGARNRGIQEACSDWVAFLDADDVWYPDKLRRQAELISHAPELGVVFCNWYNRDEHGKVLCEGFANPTECLSPRTIETRKVAHGLFVIEENPFKVFLTTFILHTNSVAVHGDLLDKVRFDSSYNWGEDWLFCLDLSRIAKFGFVDELLTEYRERPGSICKKSDLRPKESRYAVSKAPLTRYGQLSSELRKRLYPRIRAAGGILGYCLLDEKKDARRAKSVWRETAFLRPGIFAPKLYLLSITPTFLLNIVRKIKRVLER